MKAIVWMAVNRLEVREVPRPRPGPGEVLVRVSHVGICGTDLHIWRGEHPRAKPPLIMGHEFSGTVAELGPGVAGVAIGQPVVVYPVVGCGECEVCLEHGEHICPRLGIFGIDWDGAMAEYVKVPACRLHLLPAGADMVVASLIEPVAVGLHTLNRSAFRAGATATVIGAGPVGLCVALCARQAGAKQVLISDVSEYRLGVARQLGLVTVDARQPQALAEAVRAATEGAGAEFVFEATGIPKAAEGMEHLVRVAGVLVIVGVFPHPIPLDLRSVAFRELRLVGIRMYTQVEFDRAIELVTTRTLAVRPLISDVYPLARGVEAFERAAAGTDSVKVLIAAG